jgi:L-threonylcarbamoyladenylate synthase
VAVPTETVYGLAANALDAKACAAIYRAKRRPATDPLIVHLHSARGLAAVCVPNRSAEKLAAKFWPGPLTLVLPKTDAVPDVVTANGSSVAVRVPAHPLFRRLLKLSGLPLAAPSANPFGYVSPTTAKHVRDGLGERIGYILDGGDADIGVESTIVDLRDESRPQLLRPGAVTREQIERVLGRTVAVPARKAADVRHAQAAPGMLARHYSPKTRVVLHERILSTPARDEAYVFLRRPKQAPTGNVFWLDERGELRGVARRLFATLRSLDRAGFKALHVELAPDEGIGIAINDRLRRAAAR